MMKTSERIRIQFQTLKNLKLGQEILYFRTFFKENISY